MRFEASRVVYWSLSCYRELKLTTNPFTGHTLHGLLIQMQNISLWSSGMHRKQQNFPFSPPLFFRFSWSFFFSLAEHLVGFIFMEVYRSILHGFLPFSPVSLTKLCSFWYGLKYLFTLHSGKSWPWPLKLMTSRGVERTWIRTGGSGANGLNNEQ